MIAADCTVLAMCSVRGGGVLADHGGGAPVQHLQQLLVQEAALVYRERVLSTVNIGEVAHLDELIFLQTAVTVLVQGLEYLLSSLLAFLLGKSLNIYKLSTSDN